MEIAVRAAAVAIILALAPACTQGSKKSPDPSTSGVGFASGTASAPELRTLESTDTQVGKGAEAADKKTVSVLYRGTFTDGKVFDKREDKSKPVTFKVGAHTVIAGLELGVRGMRVGGSRRLVVPPAMAYGSQGFAGIIPPDSTLVFEVELVKVE